MIESDRKVFNTGKLFCLVLVVWLFSMAIGQYAALANPVVDPVMVFEKGVLKTTGVSEKGGSRYQALRSAQSLARSHLKKAFKAMRLSGDISIEEGMNESPELKRAVGKFFFDGIGKCGQMYDEKTGLAEVCMQVKIKGKGGAYECFLPLIQNADSVFYGKTGDILFFEGSFTEKELTGIENSDPPQFVLPYDGLIIDTRDFLFFPALMNRVLTEKGEILFPTVGIQGEILVENGFCGFETSEAKARALLQSRGSFVPLTVISLGVRNNTDVVLAKEDVVSVYGYDRKSNLLSQAKVVFIINEKD